MTYKPLKRGSEMIVHPFPLTEIDAGGHFDAIDIKGSGRMAEFLIVSPNTSFGAAIVVDGGTILSESYASLNALTQTLLCVSAFPELDITGTPTGKYIIHLSDVSFLESLLVRVLNTGGASTTFNIFGKYILS